MIEHRGRKSSDPFIKEKVNKLAQQGLSFQDIARTLGIKSRQLARYHFKSYRKEMLKVEAKKHA